MLETPTFDYIVVGAGSAGCVLADRLTADGTARVLLLEAGGDDSAPQVRTPALFGTLFGTEMDWGYGTVPQAGTGARVAVPRGRMLGGSSSLNAMVYIRGNRADYDGWQANYGATGWSYADVLPYFRRAECNSRLGAPEHGTHGPLHVQDPSYLHEMNRWWVDSAIAAGLPFNDDFNGPHQIGGGPFQLTQLDGRRWSTADAYLRLALSRPNLTVRPRALVHRVSVEKGRAIGVVYDHGGSRFTARADREVLLSCGSINSPKLLMLSGIGPASHLREHGIEVAVDLPGVGANLHDHPTLPMVWSTRDTTDVLDLARDPEALKRYSAGRPGPLNSALCDVGGFFSTTGDTELPDIEIHTAPMAFADGLTPGSTPSFTGTVSLLDPASRGTVRLNSADPSHAPLIDLGLLAAAADFDTLLSGARTFMELSSHRPLAPHLDAMYFPTTTHRDSAEFSDAARAHTQTMYHPVGTCAMGIDERAVVDPALRVRGIEQLRVIDASIMPIIVRGNTNAPTIMIAEKAADLIRGATTTIPRSGNCLSA
jgi:choline dehydrogenase